VNYRRMSVTSGQRGSHGAAHRVNYRAAQRRSRCSVTRGAIWPRALRHLFRGWLGGRCAVLLLRRSRPTAGEGFHGLLDASNVPLHVLHVQPPRDNLIVSDLE